MNRRGFTIAELLVALAVGLVAVSLALETFHLLCHPDSRHGVMGMTQRSFLRKDIRLGLRQVTERLREAQEFLEPAPGRTGSALVFRDLAGQRVRLTRDAAGRLVTEVEAGGAWRAEAHPATMRFGSASVELGRPVCVTGCIGARFTTLTPGCASIYADFLNGRQLETLRTVIEVRNEPRPF